MNTNDVLIQWTNPANYCEEQKNYYFNLHNGIDSITTKEKLHGEKFLMRLGRKLPGNKIHADYWVKNGFIFDVISALEIRPFSLYCEMIGFVPDFQFTKSGNFVRCTNFSEMNTAIKKHFSS